MSAHLTLARFLLGPQSGILCHHLLICCRLPVALAELASGYYLAADLKIDLARSFVLR